MKKKELSSLKHLNATRKILKMAAEDTPKTIGIGRYFTYEQYQTGLYLRCMVQGNILYVAIFLTPYLRKGARKPAYELYIDKSHNQFLTYEYETKRWLTAKLDKLQWPISIYYSNEKWISEKDSQQIREYLGSSYEGYRGLLKYQLQVREEQLMKRYKKETDKWDKDLLQTPKLPKDWERWVQKVGIPENFIFYRYLRKGVKHGYCTYCEAEVPVTKPRHNKAGRCPKCRHKVVYKSLGKFKRISTDTACVYLLQRCKDGVMIREFTAGIVYNSDSIRTPDHYFFEKRRVICDKNAKPLRCYEHGLYKQMYYRWNRMEMGNFTFYPWKGHVYGKTLPDLGKHELKKTGLIEYIRHQKSVDPEKYLGILSIEPKLEQLSKEGLICLTEEYLGNRWIESDIFQNRSASLASSLGINAVDLKRLKRADGGSLFLDWLRYEKISGGPLDDSIISWFCTEKIRPERLKFICDRMSSCQIYHYICRQMKEEGMSSQEVINTWEDYLSMAKKLGKDTSDEIIFRVRLLRKRHDELVKCCQIEEVKAAAREVLKAFPQVENVMHSIRGLYEYSDKEYEVQLPETVVEIIEEGRSLSHCIGSNPEVYWDRIERQETYILFLRKASAPKKSYYTLEVEPDGSIRQIRTYFNRQEADIEQAKKFLKKWQKKVAERLTGKEKKLAERSRELRKNELAELRKNQVIIRTGNFGGTLLADILEADLMETDFEEAA